MPERGLPRHHRVLVRPEASQTRGDELLQHLQRLRPGDGPAERLEVPRQGGVPFRLALRIQLPHLVDHRLGDRIGFKPQRLRTFEALRRRLAVVGIEIPLPTERLGGLARALHQHAEAAATFPVKQLQAELLVARGPGGEVAAAPEEGVARHPHQRHRQLQPLDGRAETAIGRLHHPQFANAVRLDPSAHGLGKALGFEVIHRPALLLELGGEVAHRAPHQHQLLAVVGPLLKHGAAFHQQHPCLIRGQSGKGRLFAVELIAQDPDADRHRSPPAQAAASPASRQALRARAAA